ncbi:MAG: hypothetical protein ACYTFQ_30865 [Planctomycetota bacterium]|jgi:hypothetical protein
MSYERQQWKFMRDCLYHLKRDYGAKVTVIKLVDSQTDYKTGDKTVTKSIHPIHRAIMLPEEILRKVEQGIAHLSANKMFVSQGGYDVDNCTFIIDAKDMPVGYTWGLDDYIQVVAELFKVIEISEFEYDSGWMIKTRLVEGSDITGIIPVGAENTITLTDEAGS